MEILVAVYGVILLIVLVYLYMVLPTRSPKNIHEYYGGMSFAHRGLHSLKHGVAENTLEAFSVAIAKGYGAELDVQLTRDLEPVVFHDLDLFRACGMRARVCDLSYDKISSLSIFGTGQKIPHLSQVLELFEGSGQTIIIEIKSVKDSLMLNEFCVEHVVSLLEDYGGKIMLESFDPKIVGHIKKIAPNYLRGQLATEISDYDSGGFFEKFALSRLLFNYISRPHFVAYKIVGNRPLSYTITKKLGAFGVSWTSKNPDDHLACELDNEAVIFENYLPKANKV